MSVNEAVQQCADHARSWWGNLAVEGARRAFAETWLDCSIPVGNSRPGSAVQLPRLFRQAPTWAEHGYEAPYGLHRLTGCGHRGREKEATDG